MSRRTAVLITAVALAGWAPAAAQTPPAGPAAAVGLAVTRPHTGWVSLRVTGPPGAEAAVTENRGAGDPEPVATVTLGPAGAASVERAAPWRCDRRTRSFTVTVAAADGTSQSASGAVRTPTCAGRLGVALRPTRPRARRPATVQVSDRWRLGAVAARVCTAQPGGVRRRCRSVGLAAIEAVCADEWLPRREIAGVLASLVDRSLVESEATARDEHRFRLLFPIRSFARERAAEAGELDELERRHAEFYADRVEEAEPNLIGPTAFEWAARLRDDIDDIRAALQWSRRSGELEPGLRIVAAIYIFWEDYDRRREWMERVVDLVSVEQDKATFPLQGRATLVRARALVAASKLLEAWDMRLATAFAKEAVELAEAMGDARVLARARVSLGTLLGRTSDGVAEARRLLDAGYDWFTEVGDRYGAAGALFGLGLREPAALAIPRWARARELYAAIGDELGVANRLYLSGLRLVREGDELDTAETLLREAVERAPRHGSERETAHARSGLGHLGVVRGNDPEANVLIRAALPVFKATGDVRCTARCETLLGVAAGRAGNREEALRAYRAAIDAAERVEDLVTLADALDGLGSVLPADGDRLAIVLHAAAAASRNVGRRSSNVPGVDYDASIRERRRRLGASADAAWAEGSALAPLEAARLALEGSFVSKPLGAGKG